MQRSNFFLSFCQKADRDLLVRDGNEIGTKSHKMTNI
jgi:hypothetical protein